MRSLITNLKQAGESAWSAFSANKADNIWLHQALADLFETHYRGNLIADFRQQINVLLGLVDGGNKYGYQESQPTQFSNDDHLINQNWEC